MSHTSAQQLLYWCRGGFRYFLSFVTVLSEISLLLKSCLSGIPALFNKNLCFFVGPTCWPGQFGSGYGMVTLSQGFNSSNYAVLCSFQASLRLLPGNVSIWPCNPKWPMCYLAKGNAEITLMECNCDPIPIWPMKFECCCFTDQLQDLIPLSTCSFLRLLSTMRLRMVSGFRRVIKGLCHWAKPLGTVGQGWSCDKRYQVQTENPPHHPTPETS